MSTMSLLSQIVRTDRFTRGVPTRFTVADDGATVLFLRTRPGDDPVSRLWRWTWTPAPKAYWPIPPT